MSLGYHFMVERTDGSPADPPTYRSSTLNWGSCHTHRMAAGRALRFWALTLAAIAVFSLTVLALATVLAYFYDR
jgi:hypothetical protein